MARIDGIEPAPRGEGKHVCEAELGDLVSVGSVRASDGYLCFAIGFLAERELRCCT